VERLRDTEWPGNVRELRNTVERLLILSHGAEAGVRDVERLVGGSREASLAADVMRAPTFAEFKDRAEQAFILGKLREHDWNVSETARSIDMPRSNLYKKIERYNLVREEPRD
jgi:two-component system, NtrC family, nitrogen regulation response regulator NtrX